MNDSEILQLLPLAARTGDRAGWRCPNPERWLAYVEGNFGAGEREQLEAHLADCAFCLAQVGFLMRADALGAEPAVPTRLLDATRKRRFRFLPGLRPLAAPLAATAALAVTLLILLPRSGGLTSPEPLPSAADSVRSSAASAAPTDAGGPTSALGAPRLLRPREGELVAGTPFELEWQAAPEALFYTVQLMNARGDLIWERQTPATHLAVGNDPGLRPGQPLFVWVIAHARSGAALRSPVVSFAVAPNQAR